MSLEAVKQVAEAERISKERRVQAALDAKKLVADAEKAGQQAVAEWWWMPDGIRQDEAAAGDRPCGTAGRIALAAASCRLCRGNRAGDQVDSTGVDRPAQPGYRCAG